MAGDRPPVNRRLEPFGTSVFAVMSRLAVERGAVNLGQGFPNFPGPDFLKQAAARAIAADHNQYARMEGDPALVRAIAAKFERLYGLAYDPMEEVTVHAGCTEAIHSTILALCEPGDEVILFEPYYDSYVACVALAGATPRIVRLKAPGFRWSTEELSAAFNERTRLVLVNTPHNPSGRVLDRGELEELAAMARQHDVYVVSDEVYEHLVYEGRHLPIATLPGMRERTVTLNSTGKTFSLTGWKIGYSMATAPLARAIRMVHQFVTYAVSTPFQRAMVEALEAPDSYYDELLESYRGRRERILDMLEGVGLEVLRPQGTYFACADVRSLGFEDDVGFCRHLIETVGVAAIPLSAFYEHKEEGRHLVRFAFCKSDDVLEAAATRLRRLARR